MPRLRQLTVATPHIEQVQDAVEHALYEAGYFETLRAYIVYREQRARSRDAKKSWVDVESSINEYLNQSDWRVNANANQGYSSGRPDSQCLRARSIANYWLDHVYTPEIGQCPPSRPTFTFTIWTCFRRLLRRLESAQAPLAGGLQRRSRRKVAAGRAQALLIGHRPDRQLPRHAAERMGGRPGFLVVRHLHGALRPPGQHALRGSRCRACRSSSTT